jgi:hypothetical protein
MHTLTASEFVRLYDEFEDRVLAAEKAGTRLKILFGCGKHAAQVQDSGLLMFGWSSCGAADVLGAVKEQEIIHTEWNCDVDRYMKTIFRRIQAKLNNLDGQRRVS